MNLVSSGQSYYWDEQSQRYLPVATNWTHNGTHLCPDLLRLSDIGEADNWRGHLVRGFFRLLTWITGI